MTRRKQVELEQAVIRAAREWRAWLIDNTDQRFEPIQILDDAVWALDAHLEAIESTPGQWVEGSPVTSENAAIRVAPALGSLRRAVLNEIRIADWQGAIGCTDDDLEVRLKRAHTSVSSARNYLCGKGWLVDSGRERTTRAGMPAVIWAPSPACKIHFENNPLEGVI